MNGSTSNAERCAASDSRALFSKRMLATLGRNLADWVGRLEAGLKGDPRPFALYCLGEVGEWALSLAAKSGHEIGPLRKTHQRCRFLYEMEMRGPGLKVPGSQSSPSASAEGRVDTGGTMCPPTKQDRGVQTRGRPCADAAVGCNPVRLADVGTQASCEPRESPTARRKRRRNRRRGECPTSASASSSSSNVEPLGAATAIGSGVDMPAADIEERGGRKQDVGKRGEVAKATPPPPASGPTYTAAAALPPSGLRPPPCASAAGGPACRGKGKEKGIPGGDVASRESRSDSPLLPRPEPKRKKGMRTPGSSISVELRFGVTELGRDVTAREFLRAVSLISACGPGVLLLGPARPADATPSPPSKEGEKGSGGSVGAGRRGGDRAGAFGPRRPPHYKPSPPVGGMARC